MVLAYLQLAAVAVKTFVDLTKLVVDQVENQKRKKLLAELEETKALLAEEREKAELHRLANNNGALQLTEQLNDLQQRFELQDLTIFEVSRIQEEARQLQEAIDMSLIEALDGERALFYDAEQKVATIEMEQQREKNNVQEAKSFNSRFHMLELLSEGVFSQVHLVQHKVSGDVFVAKLYPLFQDRDVRSIQHELAALKKLPPHDNIIEIKFYYENIIVNNCNHVLVFPYYELGTVNDNIDSGRLTKEMRIIVMRDVLLGMAHIHKYNIIHLDLKPDNFLLDCNDCVKISDFGIAKAFSQSHQAAASLYYYNDGVTGALQIPKYYTPPEIMQTNGNNDALAAAITFKCDIYQAGCSFLAMLLETFVKWHQEKKLLAPYIETTRGRYLQLAEAQLDESFDNRVKIMFDNLLDSALSNILQSMTHIEPMKRPDAEVLIQLFEHCISKFC